jgi:hypothetical protein
MAAPMTPPGEVPGQGYDRIAIPTAGGSRRFMTKPEFENLPLSDRVKLLMGGTLQFFRGDKQITAREALRGG